MSKGIGAFAEIVQENKETVIYRYGSYNLNVPEYENTERAMDGLITIQRECFIEPEIHRKIKKMPGGRKKIVTKRVPVDGEYGEMIKDGRIKIRNSKYCFRDSNDELKVDLMACLLTYTILRTYQKEGKIPEKEGYHV